MKFRRTCLIALTLLLATPLTALDSWKVYNQRYVTATKGQQEENANPAQQHHGYISEKEWEMVSPYLMPEDHPLKQKLDNIFSKTRAISSVKKLLKAGFDDAKPQPVTKIIVTRHKEMPGYIFKLYTDDYQDYHHNESELYTFIRRVRGARLIKSEIALLGWQMNFKVPQKWIYALPLNPGPLKSDHFRRNFILVEDEMDLLSSDKMRQKWKDGTMTKDDLDKIYYITTRLGLRGCCKYDNIPICKDGRIAFVDTQSNLRWPIAYNRLTHVLEGKLLTYWENLTANKDAPDVVRISD